MDNVSQKIAVVFLVPSLRGGGAERVVTTLLRHLDRGAFAFSLVVVDGRDAVYRGNLPEDVEYIDLGATRARFSAVALLKLVRRRRPDILFVVSGHLSLMLVMLEWLMPRRTRIVSYENSVVSVMLHMTARPRLMQYLYKHFCRRMDMIVCQSLDIQHDLSRNYRVPSAKTCLIHNPVDIDWIRARTTWVSRPEVFHRDSVNILAAGRLSYEKGLDLLIKAISICKNARLNLLIIGTGPSRRELEALAIRLNVSKQVTFAGFQSNPYPWFASADYLALSSRVEGFPNVVLEALACGTPVIATPCPGGIREIMTRPDYGWLADEVSAPALAEALRRAIDHPRPVPSLVDLRARFGVEAVIKHYEVLLRSMVA